MGAIYSRRSAFLSGAAYATAIATIIAAETRPAQAAKVSKAAVGYQDTPKNGQKCSNCVLFEPPSGCKSVAGVISPNGWCAIYRKA